MGPRVICSRLMEPPRLTYNLAGAQLRGGTMAEQRYPMTSEVAITRPGAQPDLRAEIERLNTALDTSAEQARRLRHEIDTQTARADLAESKLRYAVGRNVARDTRMREIDTLLIALSADAMIRDYVDGARLCRHCGAGIGEPHGEHCPVRLAREWMAK